MVVQGGGRDCCDLVGVVTVQASAGPWEVAMAAAHAANAAAVEVAGQSEVLRWLRRLRGRWEHRVLLTSGSLRVLFGGSSSSSPALTSSGSGVCMSRS
jgi:hypothetical protein